MVAVNTFNTAFGAHLRELRLKLGLTQEEVADRASLHVTYLSGIERGKRNPSLKNLKKIAQALGVLVQELFSFEESN